MPKNDGGESREADAASTNGHRRAPDRQRVAKLMARAGLCSRRDAEVWITQGRVSLNGAVLSSPAVDVGADDIVLVDGLPLPEAEKTRLFLFHKPRGLVTSDHDPEGRPTVADHLRAAWLEGPRVVTVGRLDINTEGLLLLTNDGGLARVLELPQTGWVRRYRVRAKGQTDQSVLDGLRDGVTIEGVAYAGIEARLDRVQGSNCWLTMGLREGKNREVKRVLEHVGLEVNRLIRLSFGPFQLGDLPEGEVSEVKTRILRDQLGEALAAQAGVDFHEDEVVQASPIERRPRPVPGEPSKGKPRGAAPARIVAAPRRATRSPVATARPRGSGRRNERQDDRSDDVAPARRERPVTGPRKHVSLLRAKESAKPGSEGPRKRVERTSTRDHADREVAVERMAATREAPSRAGPGASRAGIPRPSASKTGAARARAADAARRDDERVPRRDDPLRRGTSGGAGASPSARGKRERVLRSGAPSRDAEPRRDARERPSDQKRPRGGSQVRHRAGRDTAPAGHDRGSGAGQRPARARPGAVDRPGADNPGAVRAATSNGRGDRASRAKPPAGRPARDANRPMTRDRSGDERPKRPARFEGMERVAPREGTARGAVRRGTGGPGGGRTTRDGKGPASGGRRGASDPSGPKPRGSFAGGKTGGGKAGAGKTGGGKTDGGGRSGGGKAGGGRPAGRPKR